MTKTPFPAFLLAAFCISGAGVCLAQVPSSGNTAAIAGTAAQPDGRVQKKIERIRLEDAGSLIDEVRVGGETQSITVSPKGNMPSYDVLPSSVNRIPPSSEANGAAAAGGTRVWKILAF